MRFEKRNRFLQIIHIHPNDRPVGIALRDIHMKTIGILHTDIHFRVGAERCFCVANLKSKLSEKSDYIVCLSLFCYN